MEEKDLDFLREQLSRLDEPELPPSLTSAALFARMDEGALTLPEEEAAKAEKKVIPWGRVVRRPGPGAAPLPGAGGGPGPELRSLPVLDRKRRWRQSGSGDYRL